MSNNLFKSDNHLLLNEKKSLFFTMSFFFFSLPLRVGGAKKQTKQIWRQHAISTEKYLNLFCFLGWCFAFGFYRTLTFSIWDTRNAEHRDNTRESFNVFILQTPLFAKLNDLEDLIKKALWLFVQHTRRRIVIITLFPDLLCPPFFVRI